MPENSLECNSKTDVYHTDEESRKEVEREKKQNIMKRSCYIKFESPKERIEKMEESYFLKEECLMKNLNPQNQENPWILNRVNEKKATAGHIMWAEYQRRRIPASFWIESQSI